MSESEVYRRALEFIRVLAPGGVASTVADLALEYGEVQRCEPEKVDESSTTSVSAR